MLKTFDFIQGDLPILVSIPHNGLVVPDFIAVNMTPSALKLTDTDWYMDKIYDFAADMGCSVIKPIFSRYVIDLNRDCNNQSLYPGADTTELCPTTQFDYQPIYLPDKAPDANEISSRVKHYWQPYHHQLKQSLESIYQQHGRALLFEAHSIKSQVPRFFEDKLADFNFGSFDGKSCSTKLTKLINDWQPKDYTKIINGRFKGGYITRNYAQPTRLIESLQLELSQATYMDEDLLKYDQAKAYQVIQVIKALFINLKIYCLN